MRGNVSRRSVLGTGAAAGLVALPLVGGGAGTGYAAQGEADRGAAGGGPRRTDSGAYITFQPEAGAFPLVRKGHAAPVIVDADDFAGVVRVAADLRADVERVSGVKPASHAGSAREVVIVGTLGRSELVDKLVASGKLDVSRIRGKWETSQQTVVERPMPGVDRALVIVGSDQRGAIFGAYDVSRGIGVSPWYWWDDVVPVQRREIYVKAGSWTQGTPKVKFRGVFINDENPNLGTWAPQFFGPGKAPGFDGGFNAAFWEKVFEVLLRLKGNYLWPAVWGRAFAEDDPENHARATAYGVVMGTSHEAPMMRGIEEWNRHAKAAVRDSAGNITTPGSDPYGGTGEWSFRRNRAAIEAYWRDGIKRMKEQGYEGVVTLGMRGNGDVSLPDGDGIELMHEIISTQRGIIKEILGSETAVPQVWTLYKEVQRYWAKGLRAPDDVTVVFCDDNWGNIRKHPDPAEPYRSGNYGVYYHFDYVGGGRNYKWVDTTSLPNMWDQLHQAVSYGNHGLWVVNVGDLKGNELPTQFFLDYAWSPSRWELDEIGEWERDYAELHFGKEHAEAIAAVLSRYAHLQQLRKPELLNRRITLDPTKDLATDNSAVVYDDKQTPFYWGELERVTQDWRELAKETARIGRKLPASAQDAWFELVGYNVLATANVYDLREAEFTNIHYAGQGRAATNALADRAEAGLQEDFRLQDVFNTQIADGKWKGFQLQPHIDYGDIERYGSNAPWQQPEVNNVAIKDVLFPAVKRIEVPDTAEMGVAVSGSEKWWPAAETEAVLPEFSPYRTGDDAFVEIFNRGTRSFAYTVTSSAPWLRVERTRGTVGTQVRLTVSVDWNRAPAGRSEAELTVEGAGGTVTVKAVADHTSARGLKGFVEAGGYIAIDAEHHSRAVSTKDAGWLRIDRIGRSSAGMTPAPVTAPTQTPGSGPYLEYDVTVLTPGEVTVWAYLSPRNPTLPGTGLRYAVSFDGDAPKTVDITAATGADDGGMNKRWERNTSDNVNRTPTKHTLSAGTHKLRFWMVDPTVVLQRLIVDTGSLPTTYLGPVESRRVR
ncbi:glycosyl hydrolase 115 family protein [Streptomyces sp. NPDC056600]|uniref:glycosyl hydrolase 115 family protein n=1 Tax=Streptomyces sp. NPDC056600 TaxID=3345874 RepID=UPI0036782DB3